MDASSHLIVGVAQFEPVSDARDNMQQIRDLTGRASRSGVDLLVFPELSMTGWGSSAQENATRAQSLDGPLGSELVNIADDFGVTVVAGMYEKSDNAVEKPYNTLVAASPGAGVVATHRKTHLYDAWGYLESDEAQAGDGAVATLMVKDVRVGLVNCYEIRFPERSYRVASEGCEVLALSAAWPSGPHKEEHWEINIRARAIENQVWVAGASSTGTDVIGRSLLVDPLGVVRAQLDESSAQWASAEIIGARTERARRTLPVRAQRCLTYYGG
ncbi:nitrilase-related carbon-nitrogen hydrolase [Salinibacterium sp. ZJ450]|uniref:nitrilase-related carbon-nitrogen hydrolase n=1 Tax=Salinibacterium sp. ZJ450 TaxID=2708338 RepID=UPI0014241D06|nr:nitrilase-related carbon-nitrogen hydrolase [Salinibacterium sp. ZJ450]